MVYILQIALVASAKLLLTSAAAVDAHASLQLEPTLGHVQHQRLHKKVLELTHGGFVIEEHDTPTVKVAVNHAAWMRRAGSGAGDIHEMPFKSAETAHAAASLAEAWNGIDNVSNNNNETTASETSVTSTKQMSAMVPTLLSFAVLILFIVSQVDFFSSAGDETGDAPGVSLVEDATTSAAAASEPVPDADTGGTALSDQRPARGMFVIIIITSYKFYMGFLNGTYVPFLVAKEGVRMTQDRQSLFMGVIKLIYGFSMFMNPALGLISDKLAQGSVRHGRSIFMLTGVLMEGTALVAAKLASENREIGWYIASCVTWMLGEAFSDVVVEALPLEILPPHQYNLASSVRSLHFFGGALVGYIALFYLNEYRYDWLYWAYLGLMITVAVPSLMMARFALQTGREPTQGQEPLHVGMRELLASYITPLYYPGYFPPSVLITFVFCLGTPPLYFTLLMVRDLVGITDDSQQQKQFSGISMVFLSSAVLSAMVTGSSEAVSERGSEGAALSSDAVGGEAGSSSASGSGIAANPDSTEASDSVDQASSEVRAIGRIDPESEAVMWTLLAGWSFVYGVICCVAPAIALVHSLQDRLKGFYVISAFFGLTFGSVYSRFKSASWITLPPGANVANAMGVASVGQILGTGIGNFIAGLILDAFGTHGKSQYQVRGYVVLSWCCSATVFAAILILVRVMRNRGMQRPPIRKLLCG